MFILHCCFRPTTTLEGCRRAQCRVQLQMHVTRGCIQCHQQQQLTCVNNIAHLAFHSASGSVACTLAGKSSYVLLVASALIIHSWDAISVTRSDHTQTSALIYMLASSTHVRHNHHHHHYVVKWACNQSPGAVRFAAPLAPRPSSERLDPRPTFSLPSARPSASSSAGTHTTLLRLAHRCLPLGNAKSDP